VAHDPDGTRLADTPFETVALAAFLAGDGHSHFVGSVAWRVRRHADGSVAGAPTACNELAKEGRSALGDTLGEIVMALAQTRHSRPKYDHLKAQARNPDRRDGLF
jgi:hypothetical protein